MRVHGARTEEQRLQMLQLQEAGICPFCRENFEKHHREEILDETDHWILTGNDYPYDGTRMHLILVSKIHITRPEELSSEAKVDLFDVINRVMKKNSVEGASFLMRFGDINYTGATLEHLHGHLIIGHSEAEGGKAIKAKLGFGPKENGPTT